ncbi:uncharacterized protein LOC128558764 [Mercenaria mercenaria]|uniref:uncharacterized protein LOC128558764 n=1 Tax=Mercenaria mercenaria TaxID=6596 RepID=UPI00234F3B70|nr:uncharacterized protein LOC128558764 [Mercenaria mercenaria]
MSHPLANRITNMVVDEAHCILLWGASEFRPAYKKLGMLRAVVPNVKVLALTATATLKGQEEIISSLHMHDTKVISASPDRTNVFLEVKKRPPSSGGEYSAEESVFSCVDPLFKGLTQEETTFPKTVIYTQLKWCGILHNRAKYNFGTQYVKQYHSPQSQAMKTAIVEEMAVTDKQASSIRILVATEAYGMGMDVSDIRIIVHVGPLSTLESEGSGTLSLSLFLRRRFKKLGYSNFRFVTSCISAYRAVWREQSGTRLPQYMQTTKTNNYIRAIPSLPYYPTVYTNFL